MLNSFEARCADVYRQFVICLLSINNYFIYELRKIIAQALNAQKPGSVRTETNTAVIAITHFP